MVQSSDSVKLNNMLIPILMLKSMSIPRVRTHELLKNIRGITLIRPG